MTVGFSPVARSSSFDLNRRKSSFVIKTRLFSTLCSMLAALAICGTSTKRGDGLEFDKAALLNYCFLRYLLLRIDALGSGDPGLLELRVQFF